MLGSLAVELFRREPRFAGTALVLLVLTLPLLVAQGLDDRLLLGVNVWTKPIKFAAALTVYLGTLAWFAGWLPAGTTGRSWYRPFSMLVVACIGAEMVWLVGAAAFGTASHFNNRVPFLTGIYRLMGVLAVILTSASLVYGLLIWRNASSGLDPAFQMSVAIGLVMTFVATVVVAGYMASGTSHFAGGNGTDAGGLAVLGWSRIGGDLRVPHFFATHAMHFIPLFGFLAAWALPERLSRWAVIAFSIVFAGSSPTLLLVPSRGSHSCRCCVDVAVKDHGEGLSYAAGAVRGTTFRDETIVGCRSEDNPWRDRAAQRGVTIPYFPSSALPGGTNRWAASISRTASGCG